MKVGIMFANVGPFGTPDGLAMLARTAEDCGIESLWTVEHVVVPKGYQSRYPYSANGRMPGPEESPIPDPILALTWAAAHTERIRLATGILILPQRHPAYTAKEMATLDVLSKGRAILGVGIGWLREEFETLGIPFEERAPRTEEAVRAVRALWGPPQPFEGRFYRWGAVESNPKPVQAGGVPIHVGGHVEGAARRAARCGDGFFPATGDLEQLEKLIAALHDECAKQGRKPEEVEVTAGIGRPDLDTLRRYQDLGISRIAVGPPAFDEAGLRSGFEKLMGGAIGKL